MNPEYSRANKSMGYATNYRDSVPAHRMREPVQQNYHQEPTTYANIPHRNETNYQRRTPNEVSHQNKQLNDHEIRQISRKQTNSDLVNELTDRFMQVNYPESLQTADGTTALYTAPKSRFQSSDKNSRSMRPLARENLDRNIYPPQNPAERSVPRPYRQTTNTPEPAFQHLAYHSVISPGIQPSGATKQLTAENADRRKTSNELNGYQQPSPELVLNKKLGDLDTKNLHQKIDKEKNYMYGDGDNGEQTISTIYEMEESASECIDSNVLEADQKKQFSKVLDEALQLEKTKSIVVELIDNALKKLKSKRLDHKVSEASFTGSHSQMQQMKNSCFKKIEDELKLLKTLDSFSTETE